MKHPPGDCALAIESRLIGRLDGFERAFDENRCVLICVFDLLGCAKLSTGALNAAADDGH
jgi:hypothetical protein